MEFGPARSYQQKRWFSKSLVVSVILCSAEMWSLKISLKNPMIDDSEKFVAFYGKTWWPMKNGVHTDTKTIASKPSVAVYRRAAIFWSLLVAKRRVHSGTEWTQTIKRDIVRVSVSHWNDLIVLTAHRKQRKLQLTVLCVLDQRGSGCKVVYM